MIRKKRFKETDIKHTISFLNGALGGTLGVIPTFFIITPYERNGGYVPDRDLDARARRMIIQMGASG